MGEDAAIDALFVLQPDLSRLLRAIRRSEAQRFALYFARCNAPGYRSQLVAALKMRASKPIAEVSLAGLSLHSQTLDDVLLERLQHAPPEAVLFIYDLNALLPHDKPAQQQQVLLQLNWRRSVISRLQRTLVFWLPEHALKLLNSQAPDFADWYSGIYEFDVPSEAKCEAIRTSLQEFYNGKAHPADRLNVTEKKRWIEVLHNLIEDGPPPKEQVELRIDLGRVYQSTGYYKVSLEAYQEAHALSKKAGLKKLEGIASNYQGEIYFILGNLDIAQDHWKKSLSIMKQIGDRSGEGETLNNISHIFKVRGDYETALKYLEQSLGITQEIGDKLTMCTTLFNIGHIYLRNKQQEEAIKTWVAVYRLAKPMPLKKILVALDKLAERLGLPDGLDSWEKLSQDMEA